MDTLYPKGPTDIPSGLTQPSPTYKQRAWLAGISLVAFVLIYLFLAGWFVATAWRLIEDAITSGGGYFSNWLVGGGSAFLAIFMLKALFFIQRGENSWRALQAVRNPCCRMPGPDLAGSPGSHLMGSYAGRTEAAGSQQ